MLYFFNLAGAIYDPDVDGVELASIGEARVMGAQHAGELLRDRPGVLWEGEELRIEVTGADQQVLTTILVTAVDDAAAEKE